jgi:hypothetical protein
MGSVRVRWTPLQVVISERFITGPRNAKTCGKSFPPALTRRNEMIPNLILLLPIILIIGLEVKIILRRK